MLDSFSAAKSVLANIPTLVHPDPTARISVSIDASGSHVGAILQQEVAGSWAPLSFYSGKLSSAKRFSFFDRELLAAYSALCHFRFLLEGNEFVLFSNHKPLTHALFRTSPPWSAMQQRCLSYISEFNCRITHLPGSENMVADAFSRPKPRFISFSYSASTFQPPLVPETLRRLVFNTIYSASHPGKRTSGLRVA